MQLRLIRNATFRLNYNGRLLLSDPFLAQKPSLPAFDDISPNPTADLPCTAQDVLADVERKLLIEMPWPMSQAVSPRKKASRVIKLTGRL